VRIILPHQEEKYNIKQDKIFVLHKILYFGAVGKTEVSARPRIDGEWGRG
jgi:hypothetical protein